MLAIFFTFLVVWWTCLFVVLPFGVARDETPSQGNDQGAPKQTYFKRKLIINTILSLLLTGMIHYILVNKWIHLT